MALTRWLNPGAMVRDWLNGRDLRRWQRSGVMPATCDRTYWSAYEYQEDLGRLQQRGYVVVNERSNAADPAVRIDAAQPFFGRTYGYRGLGMPLHRRPVRYVVRYERHTQSIWTEAAASAARHAGF